MRWAASDPQHMPEVITTNSWDQMRWDRLQHVSDTWHVTMIETSELSRMQVAEAIVAWVRGSVAGDIPAIHVPQP